MGFLDSNGLAHFWNRIKLYVTSSIKSAIPSGVIVTWSGSASNIPAGWVLCNGENNTPDLRDKFVLGAGPVHATGDTGGAETVTLTIEQMPEHNHTAESISLSDYKSGGSKMDAFRLPGGTTAVETDNTGGNEAHNNMPPYYALCYIMKI